MSEQYRKYQEINKLYANYAYANYVIGFDLNTICPKKNKEYAYEVSNYFSLKMHEMKTSDEYYYNLKYLLENDEELSEVLKCAVKKEYETLTKARKLPQELFEQMMNIVSKTSLTWEEALTTLDYSKFEKHLNELIENNKVYIEIMKDKYNGYDVLLDDCEDDFTTKMYDDFFVEIEKNLLPLVKKILALPKKYNTKIKDLKFDIDKQKLLTKKISEIMGYTNEVGYIGETIHPFTSGINNNDVRTTTSYNESLLFSNLYSVMHEIGHALYELQNDESLSNTVLFGGTSCALHESQSRFYENYLGRSKEFIKFLYPILKEIFNEELKDISEEDIYYYVNDVEAQFKRTEADELTYPFHVLIRYKIEKMLFNNEITAEMIDQTFNDLMEKYLGIRPVNKKEGCFQDVHWTSGFGYFPTYALGSAMSAQILNTMEKEIDPFEDMLTGNFKNVNNWLKENIHKYGSSIKNLELIEKCCKEKFTSKYYIEYLINKFTKIYNL